MAVKIGSARMDENGNAHGGVAGDQTGKELSTQDWYLSSKGWYVLRAKDEKVAEKIAKNMEYACDNENIGYSQAKNQTLYNAVKDLGFDCSKLKVKCETDCARLVRVCVLYAGVECGDFYTATLKSTLEKTGKFTIFTEDKYCKSSDYLKRGDILVTRTKGHTVVVLSDGAKIKKVSSATSISKTENKTGAIKIDDAKSYLKSLTGTYKTTASLNLRSGAGTSKEKICVIPKGKEVKCYGYYTTVGSTKWYLIVYVNDNGKSHTGFASSNYLKK